VPPLREYWHVLREHLAEFAGGLALRHPATA
jgi:hypothetical protein